MIPCVYFADLEKFIVDEGFVLTDETEYNRVYVRDDEAVVVRQPNVHGDIPEIHVNGALEAAGIEVPAFETHWCD